MKVWKPNCSRSPRHVAVASNLGAAFVQKETLYLTVWKTSNWKQVCPTGSVTLSDGIQVAQSVSLTPLTGPSCWCQSESQNEMVTERF